MCFCNPFSLSEEIDYSIDSESKLIPNTVPKVVGLNAFSWLGHSRAKGTFNFPQISAYPTENYSVNFGPLGETIGTSSN